MDNGNINYLMIKIDPMVKSTSKVLDEIKNDIYDIQDPTIRKQSWDQYNTIYNYFSFSQSFISALYKEVLSRSENDKKQLIELKNLNRKLIEYIKELGGDTSIIYWL